MRFTSQGQVKRFLLPLISYCDRDLPEKLVEDFNLDFFRYFILEDGDSGQSGSICIRFLMKFNSHSYYHSQLNLETNEDLRVQWKSLFIRVVVLIVFSVTDECRQ